MKGSGGAMLVTLRSPSPCQGHLRAAKNYLRMGRFDESLKHLDGLLEKEPANSAAAEEKKLLLNARTQ